MKKAPQAQQLSINVNLVNSSSEKEASLLNVCLGDTTYRQDGVSIGRDYLRMEGSTVTRGELVPESLIVKEVIGQGSFSQVRRCLWHRPGYDEAVSVAIKQWPLWESSNERRQMLLKELQALARIQNDTLVTLHGAFLDSDMVTVVLEFMDRGSLSDLLQTSSQGNLPESAIAPVAFQVFTGLSVLHSHRILHRDIKAANILLNSQGAIKLCDFGMSTVSENSLNRTILGTTKMMSPERLRARAYGRPSDIWSVGLVLLECATGRPPWQGITSVVDLVVTVEEAVMEDLVPACLEKGLREILLGCLQIDAAKRMPANILLVSPWFSKVHGIRSVSDAMKVLLLSLEHK